MIVSNEELDWLRSQGKYELANKVAYLDAQEGLLDKAQGEAARLRDQLGEVQRPLTFQMERLNRQVVSLNQNATRWLKFRALAEHARMRDGAELTTAGLVPAAWDSFIDRCLP